MTKKTKLISLALIALLAISGCSNNAPTESSNSAPAESTAQTTEDKLSAIDYEALIPNNLTILPPDSIGETYLNGNYVNSTPYPMVAYDLSYMDKGTTEMCYLYTYETVLPDETSPLLENFAPESGDMADIQFQSLSVQFKIDDSRYGVDYDCRLGEITDIYEIIE